MEEVRLRKIFGVFLKVGAFTIGGGYAMIPVIQHEMEYRGWLRAEELDDVVVLAQSAPGLLAVNMAIFTGHKLRGLKGSVAATVGAILPSFVIILLIAILFTSMKESPAVMSIFQGIRPVVVALILVPAIKMIKNGERTWWTWAIIIATLLLVAFLKVSPIYIIIVLITGATLISLHRQKKEGGK